MIRHVHAPPLAHLCVPAMGQDLSSLWGPGGHGHSQTKLYLSTDTHTPLAALQNVLEMEETFELKPRWILGVFYNDHHLYSCG